MPIVMAPRLDKQGKKGNIGSQVALWDKTKELPKGKE